MHLWDITCNNHGGKIEAQPQSTWEIRRRSVVESKLCLLYILRWRLGLRLDNKNRIFVNWTNNLKMELKKQLFTYVFAFNYSWQGLIFFRIQLCLTLFPFLWQSISKGHFPKWEKQEVFCVWVIFDHLCVHLCATDSSERVWMVELQLIQTEGQLFCSSNPKSNRVQG